MRKEILVAIVLGILFGVLFAYGIWKAKVAISSENSPSDDIQTEIASQSSNEKNDSQQTGDTLIPFTVLEPQNTVAIGQNPFIVSGSAASGSFIVIASGTSDMITKVNADGKFSQPITLEGGINQIDITNVDSNGKKEVARRTVVYSSELAKSANPATPYRAYLGLVTDKTQESLQMKDETSEIRFVSVDPSKTSFVRITDSIQKEAAFDDVAIGDYIAALGTMVENEVLETKRIILTTPLGGVGKLAFLGTITAVNRSEILFESDGVSYNVKPAKTISVTAGDTQTKSEFSDLEEDQQIVVSGVQDGSTITARSIHVL